MKNIYFILVRNYVCENLGGRLSIFQSLYRVNTVALLFMA